MTAQQIEVALDVAVPDVGVGQVLYAAAFIHPAVQSVKVVDGRWVFKLNEAAATEDLDRSLRVLIDRFSSVEDQAEDPAFSLPLPEGLVEARTQMGGVCDENGLALEQEVYPGLYVYREPISSMLRFLDDAVIRRFGQPFNAREESYPNAIPLESLGKAHHFSSFPEHLHFLTHLRQDLGVLDTFASRARDEGSTVRPESSEVSAIQLVQNPSTCYHCYAARAKTDIGADTAVTALTKCHRFEAANHADFGRLLEFSLREVIFLGGPDYVRNAREETLERMEQLAKDWQLYGELISSNDPFFTSDYHTKAEHQRRLAMKFEYRAAIPGAAKGLAVMSSNLHGPTFSKAFDIKQQRRPINTGCLGFGLERLALAILAQHGRDPNAWPEMLAQDYAQWREMDPLLK